MKTSIELRAVLAALESDLEDAGAALREAEHQHRLATRRALLSGTYDGSDKTAAAVAAARQAYDQAELARDEAAALLAEAKAAEKAAAEAVTRDELRSMVARIAALAAEADAHFEAFVARLRAAQQAEAEARRLSETALGRPAYGGAVVPEAISDFATYLRSLRGGNPADFGPFAANRAAVGVQRIATGAGL